MQIVKLAWVGTRTDNAEPTVAFFHDVLGLRLELDRPGFWMLKLPDGSKVEVFGPDSAINRHFTTGPVAGFLVDDVRGATAELRSAGVEILYESGVDVSGNAWVHFRAPDGNIYEFTQPWRLPTALRPMATAGVIVEGHRRSRVLLGQVASLRAGPGARRPGRCRQRPPSIAATLESQMLIVSQASAGPSSAPPVLREPSTARVRATLVRGPSHPPP
jgi:catechol 2,3-dioxygenase-like lactoylglutathione lyase family enzyme